MGVGCEAPQLRPIFQIVRMGLVPVWFFYASAYTALQGGIVLLRPLSPVGALCFLENAPPTIPGRRYRLPGGVIASPLRSEGIQQASN